MTTTSEDLAALHSRLLPTPLQQFQSISKYSRWQDHLGRREFWPEVPQRYRNFFEQREQTALTPQVWDFLEASILNLEALPSMRCLMTAGPALAKDEVAGYNCAYLTVSRPEAWDEMMYLLMCGTGVGFSVESKYVGRLPVVPTIYPTETTIVVPDSKIGWASSLRQLVKMLYAGFSPFWDLSKVRPEGAVLKTFGGRASGPDPLDRLFHHVVKIFTNAQGRRLTSKEAHSIACFVLDIVVVGGVRRAAGLDLFDRHDREMLLSKSGEWWVTSSHFAMANNSAVWTNDGPAPGKRPAPDEWLEFIATIARSGAGEPGIFNRDAAREQAARWGRRDPELDYGTNPCGEIILRDRQLCNLTAAEAQPDDGLPDLKRKYTAAIILGTVQSTLTNFRYLSPQWKRNCDEERLLGGSLDGIVDHPVLNGSLGRELRNEWLRELRDHGRRVNEEYAAKMDVSPSAAIGTLKPAGNSSVLTGIASPLKPHHARRYFRRTRINKTDPVYRFLAAEGVPMEDEVHHPDTTAVITWPMKAPDEAIVKGDWSAVDQLTHWLDFREHFCEHNPSVTITVRPEEWTEVAAWTYEHYDALTGITFLPDDGGSYVQAPYEECTEDEYLELLQNFPELHWEDLSFYEQMDTTNSSRELACASGACEVV